MPSGGNARWTVYARWGVGIAAAAVLVALAVEASGRDAPLPSSEPKPSAGGTAQDAAESGPTTVVTARPDLPMPRTGPGIDRAGAVVIARPGNQPGVIDVEERVLLPEGIDTVTIQAPAADPDIPESATPTVTALQASSQDGLVPVPRVRFTAGEGEFQLRVPGRVLILRYAISGAVGRSPQSMPGRSLVSLKALSADQLGTHRVVTYFYGDVSNIQCVDAPATRQNCGLSQRGRWGTEPRPAESSRVIVQFRDSLTP